ncbi:MAG: adenosylhomocysteinase [Candidatus Methylomirabilales bacterium]
MEYDIADLGLAEKGFKRVEWARQFMPVLAHIEKRFNKQKPLRGIRVSACLHVTTETANLLRALKAGGAQVALCASNPLSTQDDVAAALVKHFRVPVFARKGEDRRTYYKHIQSVLEVRPQITMDDGADTISVLHGERTELLQGIIAGTEETTTGVLRLRRMEEKGVLRYPIIAVNDADTKHLFDNRYGTGQSTIDGILRATNILLAGRQVVVSGYGWCGRGVAIRTRGMGAHVVVAEVDPLRALEAMMDGFRVLTMREAARVGEVFITATGNTKVIRHEHFQTMRNGAILCNAGHFNVEIDLQALASLAKRRRTVREHVEEFTLRDGRQLYLLAEGRLINLTAAEGHPASVMDMSFANQALSVQYAVQHAGRLENRVYPVAREVDAEVARLKLASMGVKIDTLTAEQQRYLRSWKLGT